MARVKFDHLVVAAADLETGVELMTEGLGVPPAGFGRHAMMGTQNALWGMGPAYLELIAIDPDAPGPDRPRWFGLDDPAVQARLETTPFLAAWAVSTDDLHTLRADAPAPLLPPEPFQRDDLKWLVALYEGRDLPLGGAWPLCIQWTQGTHPAERLEDQGIRLERFEIAGPEITAVQDVLATMEAPAPVVWTSAPGGTVLTADLRTPRGIVRL